jgi:hypothetical protein
MKFDSNNPKVLVHYETSNPLASEMFEYLTDKVPFMDEVGDSNTYGSWVHHTDEHGLFDIYFHLIDNPTLTEPWLELGEAISHKTYFVDTTGTLENIPTNASVIVETTPAELWERVKREYLER